MFGFPANQAVGAKAGPATFNEPLKKMPAR